MAEAKRLEASAVNDEACVHVDEIDVRASAGESCVVLEIGDGSAGANVKLPLLLSAAASRELAANLIKAADDVEARG